MIHTGDALVELKKLKSESVQTCVTSPPYWGLRDYGVDGQLGSEKQSYMYIENLVLILTQVRRILKTNGTLWLNLGDSYANAGGVSSPHRNTSGGFSGSDNKRTQRNCLAAGIKRPKSELPVKNILGLPWRVAFALQSAGWILRQDIIWHKPNPMPESVRDRCTKSHEYLFLLTRSPKYYFNVDAIAEPAAWPQGPGNKKSYKVPGQRKGANANLGGSIHKIGARATRQKRSVWSVTTKSFKGAHFATFPPDLIEPCVLAGSREGDTVLDPFSGAGTTWLVSEKLNRKFIGIEINPDYVALSRARVLDSMESFL